MLEDHLPKSRYEQPGERVVQGQRMMQAASDIFLGWTKGVEDNRYLYWRQLRDMKGSAIVETMTPAGARVLRRQSAAGRSRGRTPDPATRSRSPRTSARSDRFDQSITDFSERYADQNDTRLRGVHRGDPLRPAPGRRGRLNDHRTNRGSTTGRATERRAALSGREPRTGRWPDRAFRLPRPKGGAFNL